MENLNNKNSLFSLSDRVIIITGGYGYLGSSITQGLASHGAKVIVLGREESKFQKVFDSTENIYFQQGTIADTESVKNAFNIIFKKFGKIDVLINNALYLTNGKADSMIDDIWESGIDGSLNSTYRCIREILPFFRARGGGRIINMGSMYGMVAPDLNIYQEFPQFTNPPHYGAAKAGVIQLTKYFASYLGKENILVNSVSPGPFPNNKVQEELNFINTLSNKNPLGRIGEPHELQGVFIFLSSDASTFITGQNIAVDGGWTIL